jgi:hypothetical protein
MGQSIGWLLEDVTIAGTLDLSGQPGHPCCGPLLRVPSEPGAGGYSGGLGYNFSASGQLATPGNGPGGGAPPSTAGNSNGTSGGGGSNASSLYLVPLVGGSGGSGGCTPASCPILGGGGGGGAGGGAVLIASTTQITVAAGGNIKANGGNGDPQYSGGGSGRAIRLVSNKITNNGNINVTGGVSARAFAGASGLVRLEAFTIAVGSISGNSLTTPPYGLALPTGGSPNLTVSSVNGVTINANPFTFPDIPINTSSAVPVVITGNFIPNNTTGKLNIFSETGADQSISFTLTSTGGSQTATSATVNVTYPAGGSRGFAKVTWVTP